MQWSPNALLTLHPLQLIADATPAHFTTLATNVHE